MIPTHQPGHGPRIYHHPTSHIALALDLSIVCHERKYTSMTQNHTTSKLLELKKKKEKPRLIFEPQVSQTRAPQPATTPTTVPKPKTATVGKEGFKVLCCTCTPNSRDNNSLNKYHAVSASRTVVSLSSTSRAGYQPKVSNVTSQHYSKTLTTYISYGFDAKFHLCITVDRI